MSEIISVDIVKNIKISDFDYDLPDERIAGHPLKKRDSCKLLLSRPDGIIAHRSFSDLPGLLPFSSLMVCNDTKVINARMAFFKPTGSRIEVFLLEPLSPEDYVLMFQSRGRCVWRCMVGNLKKWKEGSLAMKVSPEGVDHEVTLTVNRGKALAGNSHEIFFEWDDNDVTFASVVDAAGKIPIPPYLNRDTEDSDAEDYQTVYSSVKGSVAAPTAGLHFTDDVLEAVKAHDICVERLTLHVGAGTFQPVKSDTIGEHPMHTETFSVSRRLVASLIDAVGRGRKITAVGTTSVRTVESLPLLGDAIVRGDFSLHVGQWTAYDSGSCNFDTLGALCALLGYMDERSLSYLTASTAIMIAPGFRWRLVDAMVTNFHQPQSTLLLLVSSFLNRDGVSGGKLQWRKVYDEALASGYRFLSYGDACLFYPVRREADD